MRVALACLLVVALLGACDDESAAPTVATATTTPVRTAVATVTATPAVAVAPGASATPTPGGALPSPTRTPIAAPTVPPTATAAATPVSTAAPTPILPLPATTWMAPPGIHGLPNPAGRGTVAFIGERYPMPYREITSPQLWLVSPDGAERQLGSGAERVGFAGAVYGGATARAYYVAQNGVPRRGAPAALWELDLAAGTERMRFEFTSGACCMAGETAAISPDGLRVAYITDVGLRVRELEGGADFAIANDDTSTCVNDGECGRLRLPEWSVDGRYIRATLPTQEARQTIFRFVWKETPGTPPRAVARAQAAAAACQEYLCSVAPSGAALQFGTARARNEVTSPHHPPIIRRIYDATGAPRGTFEYDVPGAGLTHETLTPVTWLPDGSAVVVLKYENSYPPKLTWFLYNLDAVAQPLPIAVDSVLMAY